jgi:hypothetical protein
VNRPSPLLRKEIAVAVEPHQRVGAAVEDVDAVLAVDRDGGDAGQHSAVGQFCPVFNDTVAVLVGTENGWHWSPAA